MPSRVNGDVPDIACALVPCCCFLFRSFFSSKFCDEFNIPGGLVELEKSHFYVPTTTPTEVHDAFLRQPADEDLYGSSFGFSSCGLTLGEPSTSTDAALPGDRAGSWTLHLTLTKETQGVSPYTGQGCYGLKVFHSVSEDAVIVTGPIIDIVNYLDVVQGKVERKAVRLTFLATEEEAEEWFGDNAAVSVVDAGLTAQYCRQVSFEAIQLSMPFPLVFYVIFYLL